jgi:hypothetical protein
MPHIKLPERHPVWLRYAVALGSSLSGTLITYALVRSGLHMHSGFMLTAVVVAAWFGGFGPGLLSFALGLPGQILLRDPIGAWNIHGRNGWAGFWIYCLNSLIVCVVCRKRYRRAVNTEVSPTAVTGGGMWKLDPSDQGTVEISSPEFPHLSVSRTLASWLDTVHPEDRTQVEQGIQAALRSGRLELTFHSVRADGEVRRVSMLGVKMQGEDGTAACLVAACLEVGVHADPDVLEWTALPLG